MALRKIAQLGHPILRQEAALCPEALVGADSTQRLIDDLIDTMHDAHGAGLAATQIYESVRICVIEVHDNPRYPYKPNIPLTVLINPRVTPLSAETFENFEGCLSVPNLRGRVRRHTEVRVEALDRTGAPVDCVVRGLSAGTYQHEVDHLHGIVFVDRITDARSLCTWDNFERYHKAHFAEQAHALVARWGA